MTTKPKTLKAMTDAEVIEEFFRNRDDSEIARIKATLEAAFPRPKPAASISLDACKMADGRVDENASMMQAAEAGDDALADLHHEDELDNIKYRLFGLQAAVSGASSFEHCCERSGVLMLMDDVTSQMEKCADAFGALRQLREAKEKSA